MNIYQLLQLRNCKPKYLQFSASSRWCVTLTLHLRLKG